MKNLIIYFGETFRCFSLDQFITLLLISHQIFEQLFSMKKVVASANTCLKVVPQELLILQKIPELIWNVEKPTSNRYKLTFSFMSSSCEFEKHSALIPTLYFQVPFWPRKYKKHTIFFTSNLVDKGWKLSNC